MNMALNRRHLLLGAAGTSAVLSFPALAFGAGEATDKRFMIVILRGAMDGLAAVPPIGDPDYAGLRGQMAFARSGEKAALPLDGAFGLHPSLPKLKAMYDAHELLPIHAVATGYRDRSHFDGQNILESGATTAFARPDGWLNKALGALPRSRPEMGIALSGEAPLILRGATPCSTWSPSVLPNVRTDTISRLMALYQTRDPSLANALQSAINANAVASDAASMTDTAGAAMDSPQNGANGGGGRYTGRALAPLAQTAARFLKDPQGPVVAVVDMTGWDTHANQGLDQGVLARNLSLLDDGLDAFKTEMGPAWANTVVIVCTEFGRTAHPNGNGGTDHGTGGAAFMLGGKVAGGRVLADWPGLSSGRLYQNRDLNPTTDLRSVFKTVLNQHMSVPSATLENDAFPGSASARPIQGLLRA
jgi:uncharacterized protein (DUF1501 family)